MKFYFSFFLLIFSSLIFAQNHEQEILDFQNHLNSEYKNPAESPLDYEDFKKFTGLPFFPIDSTFRFVAKFVKVKNPKKIKIPTFSGKSHDYDHYATVTFSYKDVEYSLNIYQSHRLREMEAYKNDLFLPFVDESSGISSYGGGRYLDLKIPEGETIIIDFNKAYNPYCAYSDRYSCPIPPAENYLEFEVLAGVAYEKK